MPVSRALQDAADTSLSHALAAPVGRHPGLTGTIRINDGREAFAERMSLVQAAR